MRDSRYIFTQQLTKGGSVAAQQGDDPWPGPPPQTNWREIYEANQIDIERMLSRTAIEKAAFADLIRQGCNRDRLLGMLVAVQRSGIGETISGVQLNAAELAFGDTIEHLRTLQNSQLRRELFDGRPEIADLIQGQIEWLLRRVRKADHILTRSDHPRQDKAVSALASYVRQTTGHTYFNKILVLIAALPGPKHCWSPEAFREWRKRHKELLASEPSH